ncbi:hypothetical protein HYZ70_01985 [Candidatus Curtissbacteria bacterium]|nr:hypothetical protein [Candidatus Curtissbacteria bacterium]
MKKYLVAVLLLVIIILVGILAFILGKSSDKKVLEAITPTPTIFKVAQTVTPTVSPTPTIEETKKVRGGGILSFPKYELTVPVAWQVTRDAPNPDIEKVIFKKNGYEMSILEGGFGGAVCLYPGDADVEGPSARYEQYVEITTKSSDILRRSWTGGGGFSVCHKTQYGWNQPSLFGSISIKIPASYSNEMILEIDRVLASFDRI